MFTLRRMFVLTTLSIYANLGANFSDIACHRASTYTCNTVHTDHPIYHLLLDSLLCLHARLASDSCIPTEKDVESNSILLGCIVEGCKQLLLILQGHVLPP